MRCVERWTSCFRPSVFFYYIKKRLKFQAFFLQFPKLDEGNICRIPVDNLWKKKDISTDGKRKIKTEEEEENEKENLSTEN